MLHLLDRDDALDEGFQPCLLEQILRRGYLHAADVARAPPARACLVAAHAWDILGANHAGLLTAWVARKEKRFHSAMGAPAVMGETLTDVADTLVALPA
jgi:2-haloacid dehalogenase